MIISDRTDRWARRDSLEDTAWLPNSRPARSFTAESRPFTVLILDGESHYALSVARCLAAARVVRTHVLSTNPRALVRFSNTIESFRTWGGVDQPLAAEQCSERAREVRADLCLATNDAGIEFLSRQGLSVSVPSVGVPSLDSLEIALDKWELARFLVDHTLPHPVTELAGRSAQSRARVGALRFPLLLKPRCGGNGIGIRRCDTHAAVEAALDAHNSWDRTIAQTEIAGQDVDCSVLCQDGQVLAYTIQRGFTPTVGFRPPGGIEFFDDERVIEVVRRLMAALRWSGVAHVDLRYDAGTGFVHIIEINPRFWGSLLGSLHAGVNFPYLTCLAALGRPLPAPRFRPCRYVAGAAALSHWKRGQFASGTTGFSFTDTLFWCARRDPWPIVMEHLLKRKP